MKNLTKIITIILCVALASCAGETTSKKDVKSKAKKDVVKIEKDNKPTKLDPNVVAHDTLEKVAEEGPNEGVFAVISTDKGDIKVKLNYRKAPATVANFVSLAEGTMKNSYKEMGVPYYDGLNFHRVITKSNGDPQDFMIQGGCPLGTGTGNPGYSFQDEFHPDLVHDRAGILSMANSGPRTNGSQFFITVAPTPHLNRKHSVFGHVVEGLDVVVSKIKKGDKINSIKIERVGTAAAGYEATTVFAKTARVLVK